MEVRIISETEQEFNGRIYKLYPECKYFACSRDRLHRIVWQFHNGIIEKGFHIHHKDNNRANNSIENLCLLPAGHHASFHMESPERIAQSKENIKKQLQQLQSGIVLKRVWHGISNMQNLSERPYPRIKRICAECQKKSLMEFQILKQIL